MAATSRGIVALQVDIATDYSKSHSRSSSSSLQSRSFVMPSSTCFRGLRTIKKLPKLNRSLSRSFMRISTAVSAMQADQMNNYFMSKDLQEDDRLKKFDNDERELAVDEDDSTSAMVDTVNAVLADIVDAQKYIKETGRTTPRPMKRRALVVALALSAFRGPLDDVDIRLGTLRRAPSASRLSRTPSATGFARTTQLISQLSFGSPHSADMH